MAYNQKNLSFLLDWLNPLSINHFMTCEMILKSAILHLAIFCGYISNVFQRDFCSDEHENSWFPTLLRIVETHAERSADQKFCVSRMLERRELRASQNFALTGLNVELRNGNSARITSSLEVYWRARNDQLDEV